MFMVKYGLGSKDAISQLTTDRLTSEWKGRMDRLEEQWVQRLAEAEERNSLSLAKTKAEMHTALQERDELLETARAKCRQLETNGSFSFLKIDFAAFSSGS